MKVSDLDFIPPGSVVGLCPFCSSSDCLRQENYIPGQYGAGKAGGSYAASIFARRTASAAEQHRAAEKLRA
jgi:hypothetical protein